MHFVAYCLNNLLEQQTVYLSTISSHIKEQVLLTCLLHHDNWWLLVVTRMPRNSFVCVFMLKAEAYLTFVVFSFVCVCSHHVTSCDPQPVGSDASDDSSNSPCNYDNCSIEVCHVIM